MVSIDAGRFGHRAVQEEVWRRSQLPVHLSIRGTHFCARSRRLLSRLAEDRLYRLGESHARTPAYCAYWIAEAIGLWLAPILLSGGGDLAVHAAWRSQLIRFLTVVALPQVRLSVRRSTGIRQRFAADHGGSKSCVMRTQSRAARCRGRRYFAPHLLQVLQSVR